MAVILADSGAWCEVLEDLARRCGLFVEHPDELGPAIARLRVELPEAEQAAEHKAKQKHEEELGRLRRDRKLIRHLLDLHLQTHEDARGRLISEMATLQEMPLLRRPDKPFRLMGLIRRLRQLEAESASRRESLENALARCAVEEEELSRGLSGRISMAVAAVRERLTAAEAIAGSREMVGARAELEVIQALRQLPDSYTVINNLGLSADDWIHFDGTHLKTAQLDHLVVGPTGVFVIETKHWSREFLDSGEGHDPVKQVQRAGYLCYRLLNDAGCGGKVWSLLAIRGAAPVIPRGSHVTALPVRQLPHRIAGWRDSRTPEEIKSLLTRLRRMNQATVTSTEELRSMAARTASRLSDPWPREERLWWIGLAGLEHGPFLEREIRDVIALGLLPGETFVWRIDAQERRPLFSVFAPKATSAILPPAMSPPPRPPRAGTPSGGLRAPSSKPARRGSRASRVAWACAGCAWCLTVPVLGLIVLGLIGRALAPLRPQSAGSSAPGRLESARNSVPGNGGRASTPAFSVSQPTAPVAALSTLRPPTPAPSAPPQGLPHAQWRFMSIVSRYAALAKGEKNELRHLQLHRDREAELHGAATGIYAVDWIGTLTDARTGPDGQLNVQIALPAGMDLPDTRPGGELRQIQSVPIWLTTWPGAASARSATPSIRSGTPIAANLATIRIGSPITFSARFLHPPYTQLRTPPAPPFNGLSPPAFLIQLSGIGPKK